MAKLAGFWTGVGLHRWCCCWWFMQHMELSGLKSAAHACAGFAEKAALLSLKDSTANNKRTLSSWTHSKPTCTWPNIKCSSGRVTNL